MKGAFGNEVPGQPGGEAALDRAVWTAYGWDHSGPKPTSDEEILEWLLALNGERAARAAGHETAG